MFDNALPDQLLTSNSIALSAADKEDAFGEAPLDSRPQGPENTVTQPDAMDEHRGFANTGLSSEVQKTMRELVRKIRLSEFFKTHAFEPEINTDDARALMQVARPELLKDYIKKKGSIYLLFIKVDGEECKCLWCGNVQLGKPQRAVGHFRMKHLGHKPYTCNIEHDTEKVW